MYSFRNISLVPSNRRIMSWDTSNRIIAMKWQILVYWCWLLHLTPLVLCLSCGQLSLNVFLMLGKWLSPYAHCNCLSLIQRIELRWPRLSQPAAMPAALCTQTTFRGTTTSEEGVNVDDDVKCFEWHECFHHLIPVDRWLLSLISWLPNPGAYGGQPGLSPYNSNNNNNWHDEIIFMTLEAFISVCEIDISGLAAETTSQLLIKST